MRFDDLLKDIQSKYVGTADEHKLIVELIDDYAAMYERTEKDFESTLEDQAKNLSLAQTEASRLSEGARIDSAVYDWFINRAAGVESENGYEKGYVIEAMRGRGMTLDDLKAICDFWAGREETDATND